MKRREFIRKTGSGALLAGSLMATTQAVQAKPDFRWKMVTSWPRNFPGLGTGANFLAQLINEMSGGRIHIKVYGARELVGAFEIFDAVSQGTAEMGHGGAYYWKGKNPATQFFSAVPFGFTAQEMNSWLYYGGGLKLWEEVYDDFGLIPNPAGNTGVHMGGWFNRQIDSIKDLKGLKMRLPGLGGEVLKRLGGIPVSLPGGEIFTSLQSGAIDATEWIGPYNDLAFGFYKVAKYYYYPGWHEPGTSLECLINQKAFQQLPADLQSIVRNACRVANEDMLAEYTARNQAALVTLVNKHHVQLKKYPTEVLDQFKKTSEQVVSEIAEASPLANKIYHSFSEFKEQVSAWHELSEKAYLNTRS